MLNYDILVTNTSKCQYFNQNTYNDLFTISVAKINTKPCKLRRRVLTFYWPTGPVQNRFYWPNRKSTGHHARATGQRTSVNFNPWTGSNALYARKMYKKFCCCILYLHFYHLSRIALAKMHLRNIH